MLEDLGLVFDVIAPNIREIRRRDEGIVSFARRLAREKAEAAARESGFLPPASSPRTRRAPSPSASAEPWAALAADTVVVLGGRALGKPSSQREAERMLSLLCGREHDVVTAWCWIGRLDGRARASIGHEKTRVRFARRPPAFWRWYATTGEPMDKAGAYAAQGIGMSFIERVDGSYSNVVGLPLSQVLDGFLKAFGAELLELCGAAARGSAS